MWYNGLMTWLIRSPLHGVVSGNMLTVTYTGRKSGRRYTTPVNYVRRGDRLLIASLPERTWWRNLRGGQAVEVRLRGRDVTAQAEVYEGESVSPVLADYLRSAPGMARYFDVKMVGGEPDTAGVARVAPSRVIVALRLQGAG